MKRILIIATLITLGLFACNDITTQISGNDYYEGDHLAVIGYISNQGVVVNVQKTQPVLNSSGNSYTISNAVVELRKYNTDELVTTLNKIDDSNYISAESFIPDSSTIYYISVSASGFETVHSSGQKIKPGLAIQSVEMILEEQNYSQTDTTLYTLFGRPRSIRLSYSIINNKSETFPNQTSRILFFNHSKRYEPGSLLNFNHFIYPLFYISLGSGIYQILDNPSVIKKSHYYHDQITTDQSIEYNNAAYQVIDRVDSLLIQSFVLSSDMMDFMICVNEYLENRTDPFSIMAQKLPSNMSNEIGYFGCMSISEKTVNIPPFLKDSINVYQP